MNLKGSSCFENGIFKIKGSGYFLQPNADVWNCVCKKFNKDFEFIVKINLVFAPSRESCAGILLKENLEQEGKYLTAIVYSINFLGTSLTWKNENTALTNMRRFNPNGGHIKVVKKSNKVTLFISEYGKNWEEVYSSNSIFKSDTLYICLTTSSREPNRLSLAEFEVTNSALTIPD